MGDLLGEQETLDGKLRFAEDRMEVLEGVIHATDVKGTLEDSVDPLELLPGMAFSVEFLVLFCGGERVGEMLEDGIRNGIVVKTECILDTHPQYIHALVQQTDDMEVVIADDGLRKTGRNKFGIASVHVTANATDFGAFLREGIGRNNL